MFFPSSRTTPQAHRPSQAVISPSTHGENVDYRELVPNLFELKAGSFFIAPAGEKDPVHVLKIIRGHRKPDRRSTTRDTAFRRIRARVLGTALAARILGGA